ncbi:MAG: CRISPR-associated endonuclease Cas1, partial [Thiotrichales bacterium]|nr:CRISPR-associated endonuclease Cas1 [Thiotrichales bacterium]
FHQMTVDAFCRYLINAGNHYKEAYTSEAPESGQLRFSQGDRYRFLILSFAQEQSPFESFIEQLKRLPNSAPIQDRAAPLRNNLRLVALTDLIHHQPIQQAKQQHAFSKKHLNAITKHWQNNDIGYPRNLRLQWLSPVRLMRNSQDRANMQLEGEYRFCRDKTHINPFLLLKRIVESLTNIQENQNVADINPEDFDAISQALRIKEADLFWVDTPYYSKDKQDNVAGGMVGYITLEQIAPLPDWVWHALILGQFLGVGQRRASGFGKYQLSNSHLSQHHDQPIRPVRSQTLLSKALRLPNIRHATQLIEKRSHQTALAQKYQNQLDLAIEQLHNNHYKAPPLFGQEIPKRNGKTRFLAVAPLYDRILQKAIALELTPSIDAILYQRSYAYRKGKSRLQVKDDIQNAINQGYKWIYESDLKGFFDNINREQLGKRLESIFGKDPIIPAVLNWLAADVIFNGKKETRPLGIPQGSPLSPLLANFILDDFDADLEAKGFRLIRFADDFVVMCKSQIEAELAAAEVDRSLAELGLSINIEKSHIVTIEQGFKFVGYLFQNAWGVDIAARKDHSHPLDGDDNPIWNEFDMDDEQPDDALLNDDSDPDTMPPWEEIAKPAPNNLNEDNTPPWEDAPKYPESNYPENDNTPPWEDAPRSLPSFAELANIDEPNDNEMASFGQMPSEGLFFTLAGESSMLSLDNGRMVVKQEEIILQTIPLIHLSGILLFGNHHLTTPFMKACLASNIPVHFASRMGKYEGALWNRQPIDNSFKGWFKQMAFFDNEANALALSKMTVASRIANMRYLLQRYNKRAELLNCIQQIDSIQAKIDDAQSLANLLGYEGNATRVFFSALIYLVPAWCEFDSRNRRPPKDPFNVLLSYGYTWLYAHVDAILIAKGLLSWKGFYHQVSSGHSALASDIMESYRHIIERVALTAVNNKVIQLDDFRIEEDQLRLSSEGRKRYLRQLEAYFVREKAGTHLWQKIHSQIESLWLHIENQQPYQPFLDT